MEHKNIRLTLYAMFEWVEMTRTYSRSVLDHVQRSFIGSPHGTVQVCGAYGLSRQSLVEKLFHGARCLFIEDGTIEILGLHASGDVSDLVHRWLHLFD